MEKIEILKWHRTVEAFDYSIAVDWAIESLQNKIETENILILASFFKPIDKNEIQDYVSAALRDFKEDEHYENYS